MIRAAVLIGVNKTGELPELSDAVNAAKNMEAWALKQGMRRDQVLLFTDEQKSVDVATVRKAIFKLIGSGTVEQLIIYFSGHGVNIRLGEYWLLSDAPVDASAAINLESCMRNAYYCPIPHVVFISDACRTAAEGIQAQNVTGSDIFPNDPIGKPSGAVDVFFATTLGKPSLEIKDIAISSNAFKAIYSAALLEALNGNIEKVISSELDVDRIKYFVRPYELTEWLHEELPKRIANSKLHVSVSQEPDARIMSRDKAWLAFIKEEPLISDNFIQKEEIWIGGGKFDATPLTSDDCMWEGNVTGISGDSDNDNPTEIWMAPTPRVHSYTREANRFRATAPMARTLPSLFETAPMPLSNDELLTTLKHEGLRRGFNMKDRKQIAATIFSNEDAAWLSAAQCGLKLIGSNVAECLSAEKGIDIELSPDHQIGRINMISQVNNVFFRLADNSGMLLPAIRGFLMILTVDDGELIDLAYEPLLNTPTRLDFERHVAELDALRDIVSFLARNGIFRLDEKTGPKFLEMVQYENSKIDPALVLYAAYAYHDIKMLQRIEEMGISIKEILGFRFFDVELLSGAFNDNESDSFISNTSYFPLIPMLSKGWAILPAVKAPVPDELMALQPFLLPSLWTHFNPEGADRLRQFILTRRFL